MKTHVAEGEVADDDNAILVNSSRAVPTPPSNMGEIDQKALNLGQNL